MKLTDEQKEKLGITDERVDYYFKVENSVFDGVENAEGELTEVFDNIYEKMVFILLCRYCNNNKVAFPSVATIAKQAMAGVTKVKECIKSLEVKGYIKKVSRKKANSKENDTNLYAVKNIDVGRVATNVGRVATNGKSCGDQYKEQVKKNNIKKNHEHDSIDIFDNLFKEFGINYTKTNQASVKKLLKTMSESEVVAYLKETYKALSENKDIKNLAGAFSKKIAEGIRQVNPKPKKEIEAPVPVEVKAKKVEVEVQEEIESDQKDLQVMIGKITLALIKKKRMNLNVKLGAIKTLEEAEKFIIENNIEL